MLRRNHYDSPSGAQPAPAIGLDDASVQMLGLVRARPDEDDDVLPCPGRRTAA